jgi:hypothetical protein
LLHCDSFLCPHSAIAHCKCLDLYRMSTNDTQSSDHCGDQILTHQPSSPFLASSNSILPSNNLVGDLPVAALNGLSSLTSLIIHSNPGLRLSAGATPEYCADLSICREHYNQGPAKCRLPNEPGSLLTPCSDAASWKVLYDLTDGQSWNRCAVHSQTPCFCGTYPELDSKKVLCTPDLSRITSLAIPNNNMEGFLPQRALAGLTQLSYLDLRNNNDLQVLGDCWYLPRCAQANGPIQCDVPPHVTICAEGVVPPIGK